MAFGVLQEYYITHETFEDKGNVAAIGTTATVSCVKKINHGIANAYNTSKGLMYLLLPLQFVFLLAFPGFRRLSPVLGLVLLCSALLGSSWAKSTTALIATQGVLYALGGTMTYAPTVLYLDEWFVRRKGLAFGIMWAGTGTAGVVVPFVMSAALKAWGPNVTLRAWTVAVFLCTSPTLYFVKPRLPPFRSRRFDFSFLISPDFIIFEAGNIVQSLGFFLPLIYLPTYARSIGSSNIASTSTLVAFNVASVIGCICVGVMVDRFHVTIPIAISAIGSSIAVLVLWGLSSSLPLLITFSLIYGLLAGGFSSAWPGVMHIVCGKTARAEPTLVFAFLAAGRGIGNIVSGPISGALLNSGSMHGAAGYSGEYGSLILYTGIATLLGGVSFLGRLKPGLLTI